MTTKPFPSIPNHVQAKLLAMLPGIRKRKLKGMVCPAGGFTASLFFESLLSNKEIRGLLDNDETKHGTLVAGLPVGPISSIETNPPDFIILASMSFNWEILSQLLPFSRRHKIKLLDICSMSKRDLPTPLPFLNTSLPPIPKKVLFNAHKHIPPLIMHGSSVVLYSYHPLAINLWMRGVFADLNVLGIVDRDKELSDLDCHGLRIYSPDQLEKLEADAIIIANPKYHSQFAMELRPIADARFLRIIDLCEGINTEGLRSEWAENVGSKIFANRMEEWPVRKAEVGVSGQSLCDSLCAISAAREFARRHPDLQIQFQRFPEILEAYGDNLVRPGCGGYIIPDQSGQFLSEPFSLFAGNYQGCYHLGLGINFDVPPRPELPVLPPVHGLKPRSFIALRLGVEGSEPIPSKEHLDSIVRTAPLPVVCIGDEKTQRTIKNVDYSYLGSPLEMLRVIQYAALVLTSRTVSSHIAAAYDVPSIIWTPGDGFDWYIDYPAWNHRRIVPSAPGLIDRMAEEMASLMRPCQLPEFAQTQTSNSARAEDI